MATINLLGRAFEVGRYKLGALREAAPHIDAINASRRNIESAGEDAALLDSFLGPIEHVVAIVSIGLRKLDQTLTTEFLLDELGMEDMPALGAAMRDILQEAGIRPSGEETAPSAPVVAAGASENSLTTSSAN